MSFAIHDASAPLFVRALQNLSALLTKGEAWAKDKGIDPVVLLQSRLAPDMHPIPRQVQIACDAAKGAAARLSQSEVPSHPDTETTFDELRQRIATTIAFVNSIAADKYSGAEDRIITIPTPNQEFKMPGGMFLTGFAIPNLMFHVSMTYAILRHNGVPVGKLDFLGGI
jgi:hypothetical protein